MPGKTNVAGGQLGRTARFFMNDPTFSDGPSVKVPACKAIVSAILDINQSIYTGLLESSSDNFTKLLSGDNDSYWVRSANSDTRVRLMFQVFKKQNDLKWELEGQEGSLVRQRCLQSLREDIRWELDGEVNFEKTMVKLMGERLDTWIHAIESGYTYHVRDIDNETKLTYATSFEYWSRLTDPAVKKDIRDSAVRLIVERIEEKHMGRLLSPEDFKARRRSGTDAGDNPDLWTDSTEAILNMFCSAIELHSGKTVPGKTAPSAPIALPEKLAAEPTVLVDGRAFERLVNYYLRSQGKS